MSLGERVEDESRDAQTRGDALGLVWLVARAQMMSDRACRVYACSVLLIPLRPQTEEFRSRLARLVLARCFLSRVRAAILIVCRAACTESE